ncbi:tyrosine-type recombinase/integrase [Thermoanaerobacterium thermosaccharolyticum]|uniref:tyrosine-type recombinase/integrase n=1 Tax=Thermoanaerobacterium thermosaccharolyticum TaxID=1517 RepID=UPI003DA80E5F
MPGSIEKRGENSYRLIVSGGYGPDGKRKRYTKTIKVEGKTESAKLKEAKKELAKFIAEIEGNTFIEPSKLTFKAFVEKWLEEYAKDNLAPKTLYRYKEMLDKRILPALGHLKLNKIKPIHILEFLNMLKEDDIRLDGKKGGLSAQTIKHHYRLIHSMLEDAVKWQLIPSNPASNIDPPKVNKYEAGYYNEEEVKELVKALEGEKMKYKVAVMVTLAAGLRLGELMGLKWDHINFDNNTIEIVQANQYLPGKGLFTKDPKTETSKRLITMPKEVMDLLKNYKKEQNIEKLKKGSLWTDTGYIFTQWNGKPMYPYTFSEWFPKFLKKHGLRHITFHQLRHTSATLLINAGENIRAISARLGHSNTSTTMNIYAHALKSADKDAADKIANYLFENKNQI